MAKVQDALSRIKAKFKQLNEQNSENANEAIELEAKADILDKDDISSAREFGDIKVEEFKESVFDSVTAQGLAENNKETTNSTDNNEFSLASQNNRSETAENELGEAEAIDILSANNIISGSQAIPDQRPIEQSDELDDNDLNTNFAPGAISENLQAQTESDTSSNETQSSDSLGADKITNSSLFSSPFELESVLARQRVAPESQIEETNTPESKMQVEAPVQEAKSGSDMPETEVEAKQGLGHVEDIESEIHEDPSIDSRADYLIPGSGSDKQDLDLANDSGVEDHSENQNEDTEDDGEGQTNTGDGVILGTDGDDVLHGGEGNRVV